jgi:hypothetical protein
VVIPLHPVQFVSIDGAAGEIEKVGFVETAFTPLEAHPASTSNAGPMKMAEVRVSRFAKEADRRRV